MLSNSVFSFTFVSKSQDERAIIPEKSKIEPVLLQGSGKEVLLGGRWGGWMVTGGPIIIANHWPELTDMQEPASLGFVSDWRRSYKCCETARALIG